MARLTIQSTIKTAATAAILSTVMIVLGCALIPKTVNRPVVNHTGSTITKVYVKDSEMSNWGYNINRTARTTTEFGTCTKCNGKECYNVSCEQTVYVKDRNGEFVYDDNDLANGNGTPYVFHAPKDYDKQNNPKLKSVDVKLVASDGTLYGKNNVDLTNIERIVITKEDMFPTLIMQNNTGFPINITNPVSKNVDNGSFATYQVSELGKGERSVISYSIGDSRFDKEVILTSHQTVVLTERPSTITVQNNTGYPVTITSPFNEFIANGASSKKYPANSRNAKQIVSYKSGTFTYNKEVPISGGDVVLTLTEKDRAPIVTVLNNTGNTVNIVFLRTPGSNWPDQNMLTMKLKEDGTIDDTQAATQAGERRGSFTNKETFRFWLGNINVKPDSYDVRLDDVQGSPYVKNNVQIKEDMTLTFTQKDKP